jgi:hypothetical protein
MAEHRSATLLATSQQGKKWQDQLTGGRFQSLFKGCCASALQR